MGEDIYEDRIPPWVIGKPQPIFEELAKNGKIKGPILDIGCGTGDNSLIFAEKGYNIVGIDTSEIAIEKARKSATEKNLDEFVEFKIYDVFDLSSLEMKFSTVIESGLLHNFDMDKQKEIIENVDTVLKEGGKYYILGWSEDEPDGRGPPNRLYKDKLPDLFKNWKIEKVETTVFLSNIENSPHHAYLVVVTKE